MFVPAIGFSVLVTFVLWCSNVAKWTVVVDLCFVSCVVLEAFYNLVVIQHDPFAQFRIVDIRPYWWSLSNDPVSRMAFFVAWYGGPLFRSLLAFAPTCIAWRS
jgi:hypothetical protein